MPISLQTIQKNLESDRRFRERRHQQWTDNYLLDRDIVITNRLTQRQSVNVPLMKETRKTILASSEPQDIYFENLDNDVQKELLMNEWFKHVAERERLELLNEIDKKQEFLYGRSFWKLNIMDGRLRFEIRGACWGSRLPFSLPDAKANWRKEPGLSHLSHNQYFAAECRIARA